MKAAVLHLSKVCPVLALVHPNGSTEILDASAILPVLLHQTLTTC